MIVFRDSCKEEDIQVVHQLIYGEQYPIDSYNLKKARKKELHNVGFFLEDKMVGYCTVIDYSCEKRLHAWVGGTLPEYQGRGIFSQFYDWLINSAKELNYTYVTGNTDNYKPNMLRLLIKKGFDIIGVEQTPYGDGTKILMRYSIHKPVKLRLSITNSCNFNCFFCHHDGIAISHPAQLQIPSIEKILIQAKKLCINEITITGGEPACNFTAIEYILKYCNGWDHPPKIKIATNGVLWSVEMIKRLKLYNGELVLNISFHSADCLHFQKIYGCTVEADTYPGLFQVLNENGIAFRVNTTILNGINSSPRDFCNMIQYADTHGIKAITFMELLITKEQKDLFRYYCSNSKILCNFLSGVSQSYQFNLIEQTEKKMVYSVFGHNQEIQVSIYRLSCRTGCKNCKHENDITIGADGNGYPCYIDSSVCCGNAINSLFDTVNQCQEYVDSQPENYSTQQLYWGE